MPNTKNKEIVEKLKIKVAKAKSLIVAEYHGLSASKINELRGKLRESGAELSVSKNSLLKVALREEKVGNKELEAEMKGPTATIFSYEDAIAPLKIITEFAKDTDLPKIKGGWIENAFANASKIEILSNLPGREELLAKLVGSLKSPLTGIVNVLGGSQKKLVYALSALADKKAQE